MSTDSENDPQRLLDGGDGSGDEIAMASLLRKLPAPDLHPLDLDQVWQSVRRPAASPRRVLRWAAAAGGLALAGGAAALVFALQPRSPPATTPAPLARLELVQGQVSIDAAKVSAIAGATLGPASSLSTLEDGHAILDVGEARVLLAPDTRLALTDLGPATALQLSGGSVLAEVKPRKVGEEFTIRAGRYLVTVKGTLFQVQRAPSDDEVAVTCARGRVEVSLGDETWSVPAGQAWRSTDPSRLLAGNLRPDDRQLLEGDEPAPAVPTPAPNVAHPDHPKPSAIEPHGEPHGQDLYSNALALDRRGNHEDAATLLRKIVAHRLPNAELALYHLAELENGPLADRAAAERDYLRYEQEYPQGALSQEAALSAIELQLKRTAYPQALAEMEGFLRAHPASERASRVHLLRGNVFRSRGNGDAAIGEYAQVHGGDEDDALYFTALCEGTLGHTDRLTAALRTSLQRFPQGTHAAEVRAALSGRTP